MKAKVWVAIILFWAAGLFAWIFFSVIEGTTQGLAGNKNFQGSSLIYISGSIAFFTLPIAIILDVFKRIKKRRKIVS